MLIIAAVHALSDEQLSSRRPNRNGLTREMCHAIWDLMGNNSGTINSGRDSGLRGWRENLPCRPEWILPVPGKTAARRVIRWTRDEMGRWCLVSIIPDLPSAAWQQPG